ncbi:MAG: hypothetical protein AAFR38_04685 [Planctomycetota bacterium]
MGHVDAEAAGVAGRRGPGHEPDDDAIQTAQALGQMSMFAFPAARCAGVVARFAGRFSGLFAKTVARGGRLKNADAAFKSMMKAGQEMDRNGLTRAGRALMKHGDRAGSAFPKSAAGTAAARNAQAESVLRGIQGSPSQRIVPNRFGGRDIYDIATGRGVRFESGGKFGGFLEP